MRELLMCLLGASALWDWLMSAVRYVQGEETRAVLNLGGAIAALIVWHALYTTNNKED